MAAGIVRRHSPACPSLRDGRCNCGAGYEAWVYLPREKRKVRKTFRRKSEAKAWRADALSAATRGGLRGTTRDARTVTEALAEFVEGMRAGTIRPKGRERYKPNTIRSYDRALRVHIAPSKVGDLKVRDMQRSDLQGFADELLALGLSVGTVSNVFNPIQAFCRRAVDRGELVTNAAEGIDLPNSASQRPHGSPRRGKPQPCCLRCDPRTSRSGPRRSTRACDVESCRRSAAAIWTSRRT